MDAHGLRPNQQSPGNTGPLTVWPSGRWAEIKSATLSSTQHSPTQTAYVSINPSGLWPWICGTFCFKKEPHEEPLNVLCINSPLRLRGLPDKMATSNGGGMEVDGAGEYLSLISSFLSTSTKTCVQVAVYVVFVCYKWAEVTTPWC